MLLLQGPSGILAIATGAVAGGLTVWGLRVLGDSQASLNWQDEGSRSRSLEERLWLFSGPWFCWKCPIRQTTRFI